MGLPGLNLEGWGLRSWRVLRGGPGVPLRLVTLRLSPSAVPNIQMLHLRGYNYGQHQNTCLFWKLLPQEWD